MVTIRAATTVTVWMAVCALSACGPQSSSKPVSQSPQPQSISPSPAVSESPAGEPEDMFVAVDQVNAIVAKDNPGTAKFFGPEPIAHKPDNPYEGLVVPCDQVLPLYFGSGEPPVSSYAKWTATGQQNTFVNQLVAQYASAEQARTRFAQLAKDVPACADAVGANRTAGLTLKVGQITPNAVRFEQQAAGASRQLQHVTNTEYRLVGSSIIAVSATEPAAVVAAIADQLTSRVGG
ncbi:hypothetical protein MSP7336_01166 [Mycobacterium shimoidei]|uniref:Uncharacterized protein n=1 Tax=Mycobacterium shimoidei TaxID=29313 RepID=A0A375YVR8_MYCSH|nr:hypothetical protein MSP7336_01166 [Mycobacterium shimoidei]